MKIQTSAEAEERCASRRRRALSLPPFSCKKAAHKMEAGAAKAVRRVCYSAHELYMAKESYGVQGKRAYPVVWF